MLVFRYTADKPVLSPATLDWSMHTTGKIEANEASIACDWFPGWLTSMKVAANTRLLSIIETHARLRHAERRLPTTS